MLAHEIADTLAEITGDRPTVHHPPPTHAQTRLLMALARHGPRPWTDCEVFETRSLELAGLVTHDRETDRVAVTMAGRRFLTAAD
jgi:hypothetical protein